MRRDGGCASAATVEHVMGELKVWSVLAEPPVQGQWD
jgi:hypothetical protein